MNFEEIRVKAARLASCLQPPAAPGFFHWRRKDERITRRADPVRRIASPATDQMLGALLPQDAHLVLHRPVACRIVRFLTGVANRLETLRQNGTLHVNP